jgi:hypothetical protein
MIGVKRKKELVKALFFLNRICGCKFKENRRFSKAIYRLSSYLDTIRNNSHAKKRKKNTRRGLLQLVL